MALFLNQNEQRTQLQEKIAADLSDRVKSRQLEKTGALGTGMLQDFREASGKSLTGVGIITAVVIMLVVFVVIAFDGI